MTNPFRKPPATQRIRGELISGQSRLSEQLSFGAHNVSPNAAPELMNGYDAHTVDVEVPGSRAVPLLHSTSDSTEEEDPFQNEPCMGSEGAALEGFKIDKFCSISSREGGEKLSLVLPHRNPVQLGLTPDVRIGSIVSTAQNSQPTDVNNFNNLPLTCSATSSTTQTAIPSVRQRLSPDAVGPSGPTYVKSEGILASRQIRRMQPPPPPKHHYGKTLRLSGPQTVPFEQFIPSVQSICPTNGPDGKKAIPHVGDRSGPRLAIPSNLTTQKVVPKPPPTRRSMAPRRRHSNSFKESTQRLVPPPPPPTRRSAVANQSSKDAVDFLTTPLSSLEMNSSTNSKATTSTEFSTRSTGSTACPPLPPPRRASSRNSSDLSQVKAGQMHDRRQTSSDINPNEFQRVSRSRSSLQRERISSDSEEPDVNREPAPISSNILADMDALQKEIDELAERYKQG